METLVTLLTFAHGVLRKTRLKTAFLGRMLRRGWSLSCVKERVCNDKKPNFSTSFRPCFDSFSTPFRFEVKLARETMNDTKSLGNNDLRRYLPDFENRSEMVETAARREKTTTLGGF